MESLLAGRGWFLIHADREYGPPSAVRRPLVGIAVAAAAASSTDLAGASVLVATLFFVIILETFAAKVAKPAASCPAASHPSARRFAEWFACW